jgi:hypothetical protein
MEAISFLLYADSKHIMPIGFKRFLVVTLRIRHFPCGPAGHEEKRIWEEMEMRVQVLACLHQIVQRPNARCYCGVTVDPIDTVRPCGVAAVHSVLGPDHYGVAAEVPVITGGIIRPLRFEKREVG